MAPQGRNRLHPMPLGYLCLVLHAHLPFVRHPEYDDFLEEDWFYEAITETYVPLLEVMDGLEKDGADWRLTMSITPPLAARGQSPGAHVPPPVPAGVRDFRQPVRQQPHQRFSPFFPDRQVGDY